MFSGWPKNGFWYLKTFLRLAENRLSHLKIFYSWSKINLIFRNRSVENKFSLMKIDLIFWNQLAENRLSYLKTFYAWPEMDWWPEKIVFPSPPAEKAFPSTVKDGFFTKLGSSSKNRQNHFLRFDRHPISHHLSGSHHECSMNNFSPCKESYILLRENKNNRTSAHLDFICFEVVIADLQVWFITLWKSVSVQSCLQKVPAHPPFALILFFACFTIIESTFNALNF